MTFRPATATWVVRIHPARFFGSGIAASLALLAGGGAGRAVRRHSTARIRPAGCGAGGRAGSAPTAPTAPPQPRSRSSQCRSPRMPRPCRSPSAGSGRLAPTVRAAQEAIYPFRPGLRAGPTAASARRAPRGSPTGPTGAPTARRGRPPQGAPSRCAAPEKS